MVGVGLKVGCGPRPLCKSKSSFQTVLETGEHSPCGQSSLFSFSGTQKWPGLFLGHESLSLSMGAKCLVNIQHHRCCDKV